MSIAAKSVPSVTAEKFKEKIAAKTAKVGIMGLGYVGLPLALLFSEERFPVTGFDVDARKVDTLAKADPTSFALSLPKSSRRRRTGFRPPPTLLAFRTWMPSSSASLLRWTSSASRI